MELEGVKVRLDAEDGFAGRADKVRVGHHFFVVAALDGLEVFAGKGPDSAAITALASILGKSVGVKVEADVFSALTEWAFHNVLLLLVVSCDGHVAQEVINITGGNIIGREFKMSSGKQEKH